MCSLFFLYRKEMDETNFVEDSVSRLQYKDCTVNITPLQLSKRITQTVEDMISFSVETVE